MQCPKPQAGLPMPIRNAGVRHSHRSRKIEVMVQKLQAVYEDGVLRPVEALRLDEHQLVSVIILDDVAPDEELRFEAPEHFEPLADHQMTPETARGALSKIPGSLDADFLAERNEP
jgi:predicted DNA-binding antitoxin AbrB/MazE fold protein